MNLTKCYDCHAVIDADTQDWNSHSQWHSSVDREIGDLRDEIRDLITRLDEMENSNAN